MWGFAENRLTVFSRTGLLWACFYLMNINVFELKYLFFGAVRIMETIFFKLQMFSKLGQDNSAYYPFVLNFNMNYIAPESIF